jgi:DNA-binding response OmpR family regulator
MMMPSDLFGAKILVVDDQEPNVILLEHMLADAGYTSVSCVTDSRLVAGLYKTERYDAVLLDLNMPYMNGFDVIEALKAIEFASYLPILVITAQPDHKLRALQAGAQDFISKPFDHTEVLTRLRNMLTVRLLNKNLLASQETLEQRSAELSSANRFMDSVIENIPNMIFVKEAGDLRHIRVNRACEEITGYSRDQIVGKTAFDLFPK